MTATTTTAPSAIPPRYVSSSAPVLGKVRYVAPGHVPVPSPHNFHLPALSEFQDERFVELHNMRPLPTISGLPYATNHVQLETHGFTGLYHPTTLNSAPYTLSSWRDPALLMQHYIPDTVEMLKQITGCKTVVTESLLLRSALWTESDALATHAGHGSQPRSDEPSSSDTSPYAKEAKEQAGRLSLLETSFPQFIGFSPLHGGASPAPKIHQDYAPSGARLHLREFHPDLTAAASSVIDAEDALLASGRTLKDYYRDVGPRWALYSVWRPLRTVTRDPLALGDRRTFKDEDYVEVTVRTPCLGRQCVNEQEGARKETHDVESHVARWSADQKWYWVEGQEPEEVLIIGLFDSDAEREGGLAAGGTLHSSVELPGTEGEEARLSLELRCLCVW